MAAHVAVATGLFWLIAGSTACSYFELRGQNSIPTLVANTMEWSTPSTSSGWQAVLHPADETNTPACLNGQGWSSKHAYIGMENPGVTNVSFNAMNEHGLTVSGHAYRGGASNTPSHATIQICEIDLAAYILGSFVSVQQLREALPNVAMVAVPNPSYSAPGLQWAFADRSGDSVVVDYKAGALRIMNNSVGVLTNDPDFSWHLDNLNNYNNLNNRWPQSGIAQRATPDGPVPRTVGHGFNLLGLPGDGSPPSRFVRIFYQRELALLGRPPANFDEALVVATGLLNSVHIVQGVMAAAPGEQGFDYTQFGILKVPALGLLYIRTYEDMHWRKINFKTLDMSKRRVLSLSAVAPARDVNSEFI